MKKIYFILILFASLSYSNVPDLFEGYFSAIIGEGTAAVQISPGNWVGSLTQLEPGKGYWFKSTTNFMFAFDPPE